MNINILETEGHREVQGPQIENSNVTTLLKMNETSKHWYRGIAQIHEDWRILG